MAHKKDTFLTLHQEISLLVFAFVHYSHNTSSVTDILIATSHTQNKQTLQYSHSKSDTNGNHKRANVLFVGVGFCACGKVLTISCDESLTERVQAPIYTQKYYRQSQRNHWSHEKGQYLLATPAICIFCFTHLLLK